MATGAKEAAPAADKPAEKQDPKEQLELVQKAKGTPSEEDKEGSLSVKQLERVVVEVFQATKPQPPPAVLDAALTKARELDDKGQPKNKHKDTDSAAAWAQGLLKEEKAA